MTPGILRPISEEQNLEKQIEKQMGCMAGFLQLFDRHQIISGKRIYVAKRLPTSPAAGSTSPSERSDVSIASFMKETPEMCPPSPETLMETPVKPPPPLPIFDFKDGLRSSWKLREAPRLSLDSRLRPREIRTTPAIYSGNQSDASDADSDKNRRSPSVVARLMGLDALPDASGPGAGGGEPIKNAELRRSASESRVPRDLYRFVDGNYFQKPQPTLPETAISGDEIFKFGLPVAESKPSPPPPLQRKSFFDAEDFFPEPNRSGSRSLYGEIEKRLRMRGIDEPAKDLETLKQFHEALQLQGLLHFKPSDHRINRRRNLNADPPIVVMKPNPKPTRRSGSEPPRSGSARRNPVEERRSRSRSRSPRSPPDPSPPASRRSLNAESQRRISAVHSPKACPKKAGPDPITVRSPKNRRSTAADVYTNQRICSPAEDDTSTTISENSISSSSQFDFERSTIEYTAGRSLLERCDKLLHSIAAFTSAEQGTAVDQQPSPVSVLNSSSFLGEEGSPSPIMKRSIDFKDQLAEWDEDSWTETTLTVGSRSFGGAESDDHDFTYVSNVLRTSDRHRNSADAYAILEKRYSATDATKPAILHRRHIFDTVTEILDRKRNVSPWDAFFRPKPPSTTPQLIREVWLEVRRIRDNAVPAEDLNDITCGAIRKDMAGDHWWCDTSADTVLQIERQIFKDLVAETIRDLADLTGGKTRTPPPRRKLVF